MDCLFLAFSDKEFEKKYQKDFRSIKYNGFYTFIFLEFIFSIIIVVFNIIEKGMSENRIGSLISLTIITAIVTILVKKCPKWKYLNAFLTILHISILLASIGMISLLSKNDDMPQYLMSLIFSCPLQVLFCTILVARVKWVYCLLLCVIFHISFLIHMFHLYEGARETPLIIICQILCIFTFGIMSYYHEISTRALYKLISDSNKRLSNFEKLIKNIIPTSIFIIDLTNKSSEFSNNAAISFLKTAGYECTDVFSDLENILAKFQPLDPNKKSLLNMSSILNDPKMIEDSENIELFTVEAFLEKCSLIRPNEISKTYFYQIKFLKLLWEGKPCVLLAIDDISESHQIKELQKLDEYKDQLLATVSHDLRTPLNGMLGIMQLVQLNLHEKKDKKNMTIAITSGHLLLNMINDILDFSQINSKKLRLNLKKVNLIETVKETCKLIKFQAKSKGLQFIVKTHQLENEIIFSDNNRIQQILLNLLNNSLKFTQAGFISLSIKKIHDDQYKGFLYKIKVKDSGIGIKPENYSQLFKLFGKLEQNNPNINSNGVGLGLTISQNLVKLLNPNLENATIHLKSTYGEGSIFWFMLEGETDSLYEISHDSPKKNSPYTFINNSNENSIFRKKKENSKEKVLIVDDDMVNLMVAKLYCEYFEVKFVTANNGKEAVDVIKEHTSSNSNNFIIKGIFMDCNMPIMNGYISTETIIKLQKDYNCKETPVVGMTANVLPDDLEKCLKSGMKCVLCKPVSRNDFGRILKEVFCMNLKNGNEI